MVTVSRPHKLAMAVIVALGVGVAVGVQYSVNKTAERDVELTFSSEFSSYIDRFTDFFSNRYRALEAVADAVSSNRDFPSVEQYARVRSARVSLMGIIF
jgi:hypothetical protein